MTLTDLTELVGIAVIAVGVALYSLPAGIIAAGALLVLWSVARAWQGRDLLLTLRRTNGGRE